MGSTDAAALDGLQDRFTGLEGRARSSGLKSARARATIILDPADRFAGRPQAPGSGPEPLLFPAMELPHG